MGSCFELLVHFIAGLFAGFAQFKQKSSADPLQSHQVQLGEFQSS